MVQALLGKDAVNMKIEYVTHMGDDLMVVDAARVSFDKQSQLQADLDADGAVSYSLSEKDTKLIKYLANHGHISPFFHPQLQVRVTAPIFIANQLKRHQVGLALNEVSRRYVDDAPEFFMPDKWRGRPPGSIKQGSSDEAISKVGNILVTDAVTGLNNHARDIYNSMLHAGVAPEMARMVLPQSMYTSWIWTGSLAAFVRVYTQRIDPHAQKEVQEMAQQLGEILERYWPVSFAALKEK